MPRFKFAKLVRDKIVEHQQRSGARPVYRTLSDDEHKAALVEKIIEEVGEITHAAPEDVTAEIADVQQALNDLREKCGVSISAVTAAQKVKNDKNGAFKEGLYVEYIDVDEGDPWIEYYRQHPDRYPQIDVGKTAHDSETPAQGQQVITACALIHHTFDGVVKVFLPKRADGKKFLPGVYEIPGGHIDFGEHIVDGLRREIREELEVDVRVGDPFAVFDYMNEVKGSHSVEVIYFATLTGSPGDITLHPDDHSAYVWAAEEEINTLFSGDEDDPELRAIHTAFALLKGGSPDFAG